MSRPTRSDAEELKIAESLLTLAERQEWLKHLDACEEDDLLSDADIYVAASILKSGRDIDIAALTGHPLAHVRLMLGDMVASGELVRAYRYSPNDDWLDLDEAAGEKRKRRRRLSRGLYAAAARRSRR